MNASPLRLARRQVLGLTGAVGAGAVLSACASPSSAAPAEPAEAGASSSSSASSSSQAPSEPAADHGPVTITEGEEGITRVSTFEVPRDAVPAMVEHLGGAGDTLAAQGGGLVSAAVLVAKDAPGQPPADQVRVVHHARWSSAADADAAADALAPGPDLSEAVASAVVHDQELRAVVSAAPGKVLQVSQEGPTTLLITLDAKPGEHDFLVDFNVSDTDTLFADRPGFVGASIYADMAGVRIFELVQWATLQDFAAVAASPEFAEHNDTAVARATAFTAGPYDVVHTTGGTA